MARAEFPPVFDGHNDTILSIVGSGRSFFERGTADPHEFRGGEGGHLDLPRAREGRFAGGFFAVFIADPPETDEPMALEYAQSNALKLLGRLMQLEQESEGLCKIVRTAGEIEQCIEDGVLAMLLHLEGAEPIDAGGEALEVFYNAGVRSLGLTHSRDNIFGHGVRGGFPASPDMGPGLTDAGKALVRQCNELGILVDLSHLNERGFWDVAEISDAPLVATHSNAHHLTPHPRNLTTPQLDAVKESGGMVALNFAVSFLRDDGEHDANTPVSRMIDHLEYLIDTLGVDCVGIGSDYDGTIVPAEIRDAAGLWKVLEAMRDRGYNESTIEKVAYRNWIRVLRATWAEL